jgi:phosphate-selective porin OprO/OprP
MGESLEMRVKRKITLASLALAGLGAFMSGPALAASMTVDSNGGLEIFEMDNQDYWFKLSGRVHLNQVWAEGGEFDRTKFPSGSQIRRARVTLKGGVGNNWVYKFDLDHLDRASITTNGAGGVSVATSSGVSQFGEAFIGYIGCRNIWLALGQVSIPFGLEAWASSNDLPFMEMSLPSQAFAPDYGIGAYAEWHGEMFTLAGAIYHPRAGTAQTGDVLVISAPTVAATPAGAGPLGSDPGSDPLAYAARFTFSPVHDDYTVYHFGASGRYQNLHDHANGHNFFAGMEARSRQAPFVFTNIPLNSAHDYTVFGLELAGRWGPLSLQGEYMYSEVDREGNLPPLLFAGPTFVADTRLPGGDFSYHGYYVSASYVITGETKEYDFVSGTFGRVRPKSHKGAWEVVARHSYVNLVDDQQVTVQAFPTGVAPNNMVGSAHSTTVGLNWWVNNNVRFLANYVHTSLPNTVDIDLLGISAQVKW